MREDLDRYRCPICSQLAELVISEAQAICGNEACRVFIWTPGDTAEQLLASANVIDLDALVEGSAPRSPEVPPRTDYRHGDPGE